MLTVRSTCNTLDGKPYRIILVFVKLVVSMMVDVHFLTHNHTIEYGESKNRSRIQRYILSIVISFYTDSQPPLESKEVNALDEQAVVYIPRPNLWNLFLVPVAQPQSTSQTAGKADSSPARVISYESAMMRHIEHSGRLHNTMLSLVSPSIQ